MKKNRLVFVILAALCAFSASFFSAAAYEVIYSSDYEFPDGSDLPPVLALNQIAKCGNYSIQIIYNPLVTKSMNAIVGDYDFRYLVLRVKITNNSEETVGWMAPESFHVREIYRNSEYGTYPLDALMSAKGAAGYSQKAFYGTIEPGTALQTILVFDVFPEAEGWILNFSPHMFGEEPAESIEFRLPTAVFQ